LIGNLLLIPMSSEFIPLLLAAPKLAPRGKGLTGSLGQ
jgi:hypothetical protein